jgi:tight adherence protein B
MGDLLFVFIAAFVFLAMMGVGSLAWWSISARREADRRELSRRIGLGQATEIDSIFQSQDEDPMVAQLGAFGAYINGAVQQAGTDDTASDVLARMGIFALVGMLCSGMVFGGLLSIIGIFTAAVPLWALAGQAEKRANMIGAQLPDGLDLVARTLRAGHGLGDSIRVCAEELPSPLADEFLRLHREHHLGRDIRVCLEGLARRNPRSFDLRLFVSAVLLQRQTGGNLVEILENMADTVRERTVFVAKVKALTAEARVSASILTLLPVVVGGLVLVMRPGYLMPLVNTELGNNILTVGGTMFCIGIVSMRHFSTVDV